MFTKELKEWYSDSNVSQLHRETHSKLLYKFLPIIEESLEDYKAATKYENASKPYVEYDCCDNGCMVYAGTKNEIKLFCPICPSQLSRYYPCSLCHNQNKTKKCNHHSRNSNPRRTIRYRSIKHLLIKLIQYESFREALKYEFENPNKEQYSSSMDGESSQRNKREMQEQFDAYKAKTGCSDIESISVLLSWFYDGTQLFKSVCSDMAPMFISFLNLPHCLRNLHGVGSFLLSLFTFKKDGVVEDFLMNDLFIAELIELAKGFEIEIEGRKYFVLLRLINHIQDLMGFNAMLKVQNMAKSHEGCIFCNCGSGRSVYCGDSKKPESKYDGHRQYMSIRHPTRTNGYSRQCCPADYYKNPSHERFWEKDSDNKASVDFGNNQIDLEKLTLCVTSIHTSDTIYSFLDPTTKFQCPYNWFDSNSEYGHYKEYLLWYPHACFIPRIDYVRTSNDELIQRVYDCIKSGKPSQGIKAAWAFLIVSYVNFATDVTPSDPYHDLKAIFEDVLSAIKNEKTSRTLKKSNPIIKDELKKKSKKRKHSETLTDNDDDIIPPWAFQPSEQKLADYYVHCILIPYGSSKLKMPPVFSQSGLIKMTQIVTVFTVFLDIILLASKNMTFAYKQHHRMFAGIVNRMRAPNIYKSDILPLYWRAREWLCLFEGLYPVSEMTIMKHFIPDIILHIKNQGPLHCFQTVFGETLVAVAKRKFKRNGGKKIEFAAYEKIFEIEEIRMNKAYGETLRDMMNPLANSSVESEYKSLDYNVEEKKFKVDFRKNTLHNKSKYIENEKLLPFEFDEIIALLMKHIESKTNLNIEDAISSSSFYRVISFLQIHNVNNNSLHFLINKYFNQLIKAQSSKHLVVGSNCNDEKINHIDIWKQGKLHCSDRSALSDIYVSLIESFQYKLNATINGTSHYGRGFRFSQKEQLIFDKNVKKSTEGIQLQNNTDYKSNSKYVKYLSYLNDSWYEKDNYSSWCKLHNYYAQLNYFFSINVKTDSYVSSIKIASTSARKTLYPDFSINYQKATGIDIFNETLPINHINLMMPNLRDEYELPKFSLFSDILPTRVASIGFVKRAVDFIPIDCDRLSNDLPKYLYDYQITYDSKKRLKNPKLAILNDPNFPIQYLGLIDISPENCIDRETSTIFETIQWMDDIWDEDQSERFRHSLNRKP